MPKIVKNSGFRHILYLQLFRFRALVLPLFSRFPVFKFFCFSFNLFP
jgi:hypothetical protein